MLARVEANNLTRILSKLRFRLFWKILLSLWLVFFSIFILNLIIIQTNTDDVRFRPVPPHHLEQLNFRKNKLKYLLKGNSRIPLRANRLLKNTFLIDKEGDEYFGKNIPEILLQLHHQVLYRHHILLAFKKESHYIGGTNIKLNNKVYKIYFHQKVPLFSQGYFGLLIKEFTKKLVFITFVVSFPISFLIAWFFNRPISQLQKASLDLIRNLKNNHQLIKMTKRTDEFGDLAVALNNFAEHLNSVIQTKNRLLSDVSHELRSPLARQKIAVALAENALSKDHKSIQRIKLEGKRLESMITSLLDYARLDDTSETQTESKFNLSDSLNKLTEDAEFEAEPKGLIIKREIQPSIYLLGVESILLSGIENLLRNSIRYANKLISISVHLEKNSINITIEDDGCGVESNELKKIFDAFYRPQVDRSRDTGGVGLGLSIASKAISIHHGQIRAESVYPQGLRIVIDLPS
ncbi:MAG: two-component system sensor histidine kinase CpxA [Polaribacter sp.]|jgi:two-component system sensor histidine kinase CpxA